MTAQTELARRRQMVQRIREVVAQRRYLASVADRDAAEAARGGTAAPPADTTGID